MASEDTLIGNDFRFQVGNGASPEVFSDMCAVVEASGIGEESPLVDTTTLCDEARTYRRGLPDGAEFPLVLNFIQGDAQTRALYQAFKSKAVVSFRMVVQDVSPPEYYDFRAIIRAWNLQAPSGEKSSVNFTLKVTGQIEWVYAA